MNVIMTDTGLHIVGRPPLHAIIDELALEARKHD